MFKIKMQVVTFLLSLSTYLETVTQFGACKATSAWVAKTNDNSPYT